MVWHIGSSPAYGDRYIAKSETWFDADTAAELVDDYRPDLNAGLFRGYRNGKLDEEICPFDEFELQSCDD